MSAQRKFIEEREEEFRGESPAKSGPMLKKTEPVVSLTGYLIPWDLRMDAPALLNIPGVPGVLMPIFKSSGRLHDTMSKVMGPNFFYTVKAVDDGDEFVSEITESGVTLILDPFFLPNGNLRFFEVKDEDDDE